MTSPGDRDFAAYMQPRWPALVRSAVLLGCSPDEAEDVAQAALTRCYVNWPKVGAADDRDAYVYRILVHTLASSRRRRWWGERPTHRLPVGATGDLAMRGDTLTKRTGPDASTVHITGDARLTREADGTVLVTGVGSDPQTTAFASCDSDGNCRPWASDVVGPSTRSRCRRAEPPAGRLGRTQSPLRPPRRGCAPRNRSRSRAEQRGAAAAPGGQ